jgi:hypothetical protein
MMRSDVDPIARPTSHPRRKESDFLCINGIALIDILLKINKLNSEYLRKNIVKKLNLILCPTWRKSHAIRTQLARVDIEWLKSLGGRHLCPHAVKILAFGHNMLNYNICQVKYWHFVLNQFSGLFYWRRFLMDDNLKATSQIFSSDL